MGLLEDRTAVFIVRVWCECGDGDSAIVEWRGSVEHVKTGARSFFRTFETLIDFMKPHLDSIGIDAGQRFWEHIGSALDDAPATPAFDPIETALPCPAALKAARPSNPLRKRR